MMFAFTFLLYSRMILVGRSSSCRSALAAKGADDFRMPGLSWSVVNATKGTLSDRWGMVNRTDLGEVPTLPATSASQTPAYSLGRTRPRSSSTKLHCRTHGTGGIRIGWDCGVDEVDEASIGGVSIQACVKQLHAIYFTNI